MDAEAIARYAELMRENLWDFERSPLPVLFEHEDRYLIGDGHHRIEAARKVGADILCEIFPASQIEEALLYSIRAIENSQHGLPLRPKDQRKRISMFLDLLDGGQVSIVPPEGYQEWSSRAIATYLRLPESGYRTVASIRKERATPPEHTETTTPPTDGWIATPPEHTEEQTTTPPPGEHSLGDRRPFGSLDRRFIAVLGLLEVLEDEQLTELKKAIENEEIRRSKKRDKPYS